MSDSPKLLRLSLLILGAFMSGIGIGRMLTHDEVEDSRREVRPTSDAMKELEEADRQLKAADAGLKSADEYLKAEGKKLERNADKLLASRGCPKWEKD